MVALSTVTAKWTGFLGEPGYSKFRFSELLAGSSRQAAVDAVRQFFFAQINVLRSSWTITVDPIVQTMDVSTGDVLRAESAPTAPPAVVGAAGSTVAYAGGSGYVVRWITGVYLDGRLLAGKTYMVPACNCYDPDGTLTATAVSAAKAAGDALATNSSVRLQVWHRRFELVDGKPQQTSGAIVPVVNSLVPDRAATMRSRRV